MRERCNKFETEAIPHLGIIHRTAARLLGDGPRADDLTQEVYLNAWRAFDRYEPGTNCKAWLFRILHFTVQHHHRREHRYAQPILEMEDFLGTLQAAVSVREDLTDPDLLRLLQALPEGYRTVLVMVDLQEYSYREVAESLGIPLGTVMSRLSRARRRMRELIGTDRPYAGYFWWSERPGRTRPASQTAVGVEDTGR